MKTQMYYKLNENNQVIPTDLDGWSEFFQDTKARRVGRTSELSDGTVVSTMFLDMDMSFSSDDTEPPIVFESMVFSQNRDYDQYQERFATWEEAADAHERIVGNIIDGKTLNEPRKSIKLNLKTD